jgi:glycosyltransferase involved in cell wall biosynthesis
MNILQVYQIFNPEAASGAAKVAYYISKELARKGHNVIYYASDIKDKDRKLLGSTKAIVDGITVQHFRTVCTFLAKRLKIYITPSLIRQDEKFFKKINVIHLHGYRSFQNIIIHHYAKKYGIPYVLQAHGSLPRINAWQALKWLYDILFGYQLLRDAAKVIALSRVEAEQYRAMGVPEEKIVIIPNGIDISEYAELPPKGVFKKKFSIPEDRKIILYLGRIHKIKGIDILIKAYAYMRNKMNLRDIVLVIAGPDDGYLNEAKRLAQALDVSNHVLFTGPLYGEDKMAAYIDSEVYVLPSRYETFPMTILEAYACEKPVVASEVGGLKDLVKVGETGLLFEPGNVKQLAEGIFNILSNYDNMAKEMGLRGKNFVKENFTIERVIEKLEKLYKKIVEK